MYVFTLVGMSERMENFSRGLHKRGDRTLCGEIKVFILDKIK
jgi:hypothetical protein